MRMNEDEKRIPVELDYSLSRGSFMDYKVIGRVVKKYEHKAVVLLSVLNDGCPIPMVMKKGVTENYSICKMSVGLGDIIAVQGTFVEGRGNRKELQIQELKIIKKCELSAEQTGLLPDGRYTGYKARQYYHTLMAVDDTCTFLLEARSKMLHTLYETLNAEGYTNCTTPVLQHGHFAGGARPFITHMLDNNTDMYLRVTSEIALKHIIAGGLSKVYEIGNSFRNGSVNAMHNTPFMGAEIYQAYCREPEHRETATLILQKIQKAVTPVFKKYNREIKVDFSGEIPTMTFEEYIQSKGYSSFKVEDYRTYPTLPEVGEYTGNEAADAKLLYKWFKNYVIRDQITPVYITDQPSGISPLIARKGNKTLHRTYLVANGATVMEIAQSETDSEKVIQELMTQQEQKGENSYPCDYSALIHAYRFGIPPMCSLFIGVDRLIPAMLGADSINKYQMYI